MLPKVTLMTDGPQHLPGLFLSLLTDSMATPPGAGSGGDSWRLRLARARKFVQDGLPQLLTGLAIGVSIAIIMQGPGAITTPLGNVAGALASPFKGTAKKRRKGRGPTTTVTLREGETVGDLVVTYVGDYTERNLSLLRSMNRGKLDDLDLVQPGTVLRVPDNRRNIYEPESEADLATSDKATGGGGAKKNSTGGGQRDGNILAAYDDDDGAFGAAKAQVRKRLAAIADKPQNCNKKAADDDSQQKSTSSKSANLEVVRDNWLSGDEKR